MGSRRMKRWEEHRMKRRGRREKGDKRMDGEKGEEREKI